VAGDGRGEARRWRAMAGGEMVATATDGWRGEREGAHPWMGVVSVSLKANDRRGREVRHRVETQRGDTGVSDGCMS